MAKKELPRAATVISEIRALVGVHGVVQMLNYGNGLGSVHVSIPSNQAMLLEALALSEDWGLIPPPTSFRTEDDTVEDSSITGITVFRRWVLLDKT